MSFLAPPKIPAVNVPPPPPPAGKIQGEKPGMKSQQPTALGAGLKPDASGLGTEALVGAGGTGKTFLGQ